MQKPAMETLHGGVYLQLQEETVQKRSDGGGLANS